MRSSECYKYLNCSIKTITTGLLQQRPNVDIESLATTLISHVQTLWRSGVTQRVVRAVINTIVSRVGLRIDNSAGQMKVHIDVPERLLKLKKRDGGLGLNSVGYVSLAKSDGLPVPPIWAKD